MAWKSFASLSKNRGIRMNPLENPRKYQNHGGWDFVIILLSLMAALVWAWTCAELLL
jgi:hypothetical protein